MDQQWNQPGGQPGAQQPDQQSQGHYPQAPQQYPPQYAAQPYPQASYPQQGYQQPQYPPQYAQGPQYPQQPMPPDYQAQQQNQPPAPQAPFDHSLVTTAFELPGVKIARNFGVVRGIIVRSRSIVGNIGAAFQSMAGGNITLYTELCERARRDAYELMIRHASALGGNAVIGVRYDATEISQGITEFLCYGTAVQVTSQGE
jgi:uncharacterized protein YbjQ (UPF0145 family)